MTLLDISKIDAMYEAEEKDVLGSSTQQPAPQVTAPSSQLLDTSKIDAMYAQEDAQSEDVFKANTAAMAHDDTNPNEFANARKLGKAVGLPAPLIKGDIKSIEQRLMFRDLEKFAAERPSLLRYYQNPEHAALSRNDRDALAALHDSVDRAGQAQFDAQGLLGKSGTAVEKAARSVYQGRIAGTSIGTSPDMVAAFDAMDKAREAGDSEYTQPLKDFFTTSPLTAMAALKYAMADTDEERAEVRQGQKEFLVAGAAELGAQEEAIRSLPQDVEFNEVIAGGDPLDIIASAFSDPERIALLGIEGAIYSAEAAPLFLAGPQAALGMKAMMNFQTEKAMAFVEEMNKAGIDLTDRESLLKFAGDADLIAKLQATATRKGIGNSIVSTALDYIGFKGFKNRSKGFLPKNAKDVGKDLAMLGIQTAGEVLEETAGQLLAHGEIDAAELTLEGLGGFGPAMMETYLPRAAEAYDGIKEKRKAETKIKEQTQAAEEHTASLDDIINAAKETETAKLDIDALKAAVSEMGKDAGINEVILNPKDVKELMQDDFDLAAFEDMGLSATEVQEAIDLGEDVRIPIANYVEAGITDETLHQRMSPAIRAGEENLTANELEQVRELEDQAFLDRMQEVYAQEKMHVDRTNEEESAVYDQIFEQVRTNSESLTESRANTKVQFALMKGIAHRSGKTIKDVYAQFGPQITREVYSMRKARRDYDATEQLIGMARLGKFQSDADIYGLSLLEWIDRKGGLKHDSVESGDIKGAGIDEYHSYSAKTKKGKKVTRVFKDRNQILRPGGMSFDDMALLAWEEGYFGPDQIERPTVPQFIELMRNDLSDERVYVVDADTEVKAGMREQAAAIRDFFDAKGMEIPKNNKEVRDAILQASEDGDLELMHPAWHGTPHDVDKFSTDAIGTGEGAQMYGWGLYFASREDVAKWYRDTLTERDYEYEDAVQKLYKEAEAAQDYESLEIYEAALMHDTPVEMRDTYTVENGYSESFVSKANEAIAKIEGIPVTRGNVYKVELSPTDKEYLDWDETINEARMIELYEAMQQDGAMANFAMAFQDRWYARSEDGRGNFDGADLYAELSKELGSDKAASLYLNSIGVKGIKYLDQGARANGDGSQNFVIFDDSNVEITELFQTAPATDSDARILYQDGVSAEQLADDIRVTDTPDKYGDRGSVQEQINALAQKIGGDTATIRVVDKMEALVDGVWEEHNGAYMPDTNEIVVSMAAIDKIGAAHHELIHFLKSSGAFTDAQWKALEGKAEAWRKEFGIDDMYDGLTNEQLNEEAIAEAFRAHENGTLNQPGVIGKAFDAIKNFVNGIRSLITKQEYLDARQVLADVAAGQMARQVQDGSRSGQAKLQKTRVLYQDTEYKAEYDRLIGKFKSSLPYSKRKQVLDDYLNGSIIDLDRRHIPAREDSALELLRQKSGLMQGDTDPRGSFRTVDGKPLISMFERANKSTMLHETGHLFLHMLETMGETIPEMAKEHAVVQQWWLENQKLIAKESEQPVATVEAYLRNGTTGDADVDNAIWTAKHEQFARTFEHYLMTGKAPSKELQSVFRQFKQWLTTIYEELRNLRVKPSKEVTAMFDRMLATDEEIAQNKKRGWLLPSFSKADDVGWTEDEHQKYLDKFEEATEKAQEQMLAELMKDIKAERTDEWNNTEVEVRERAESDLRNNRIWRAINILRKGYDPLTDSDVEPVKLNREAVVNLYDGDESVLDEFPSKKHSTGITRKDGLNPELVADDLGFASAKEMLDSILNFALVDNKGLRYPTQKELVDEQVSVEMDRLFGTMLDENSIKTAAMDALHDADQAEVMALELAIFKKLAGKGAARKIAMRTIDGDTKEQAAEKSEQQGDGQRESTIKQIVAEEREPLQKIKESGKKETFADLEKASQIPIRVVRELVRRRISAMSYSELSHTNRFAGYERNAERKAMAAAKKGDYDAAADFKFQALINHYTVIEIQKARKEADAHLNYLRKFRKKKKLDKFTNIPKEIAGKIKSVLSAYGLDNWTDRDAAKLDVEDLDLWANDYNDLSGTDIVVQPGVNGENITEVKDMPLPILRDLRKTVESIMYNGKKLSEDAKAEFNAEMSILGEQVTNNGKSAKALHPEKLTGWQSALNAMQEAAMSLEKPEFFLKMMDGFQDLGPLWRAIYMPIQKASEHKQRLMNKMTDQYAVIMRKFYADSDPDEKLNITGIRYAPSTRRSLVSVALNVGNADNKEKLMKGYGWTQADLDHVLSFMNDNDWDFVEAIGKLINQLWPDIKALEERTTGVAPERIEGESFTLPSGRVIAGFYYPIKYDAKMDKRTTQQQEEDFFKKQKVGGFTKTQTKAGATHSRVAESGKVIRMDLDVISEHIGEVIQDISHREAVNSVNKILKNKVFVEAMQETHGLNAISMFERWLTSVAADGMIHPKQWPDKVAQHTRVGMSVALMGFSFRTAVQQPLGITQSISMLGMGALKNMMTFMTNPLSWNKKQQFVFDKSVEMRNRAKSFDREVADVNRSVEIGKIADLRTSSFLLIAYMDKAVSIPTWYTAYEQALSKGKSDQDAVMLADQAVRMTQASGLQKDLSNIQQGSELVKILTLFYSFFSSMHNMLIERYRMTDFKKPSNYPVFLYHMALLIAIPAIAPAILFDEGPEEDEDEVAWALKQSLIFSVSGIPMARDAVAGLFGKYGYNASPLGRAGETVVNAIPATGKLIYSVFDDEVEVTGKDIKDIVFGAGYMAQLPVTQFYKTGDYLYEFLQGNTDDETAWETMVEMFLTGHKED